MNMAMDALFGALDKASENQKAQSCRLDPHRIAEGAIMAIPGFDYGSASDIFAAFQAKLENVYEEKLDAKVEDAMDRLKAALDRACGNG
jgi:hypothetical protein